MIYGKINLNTQWQIHSFGNVRLFFHTPLRICFSFALVLLTISCAPLTPIWQETTGKESGQVPGYTNQELLQNRTESIVDTISIPLSLMPSGSDTGNVFTEIGNPNANKYSNVIVPPGVDTLVAILADSLASELFVSYQQEQTAREMLDSSRKEVKSFSKIINIFRKRQDENIAMTLEDSIQWGEYFDGALNDLDKANWQVEKKFGRGRIYSNLSFVERNQIEDNIRRRIARHLENARDKLIAALKFDPFSTELRFFLVDVLNYLAVLKQDIQEYKEADAILTTLQEIWPADPSYVQLKGDNYLKMDKLNIALHHYRSAEDLLWEQVVFNNDQIEPSVGSGPAEYMLTEDDRMWLTQIIDSQLGIEYKLGYSSPALSTLNRLIAISSGNTQKNYQAFQKDLIWDNGNLWTLRQSLIMDSLIQAKDYGEAVKIAELMIPWMSNQHAKSKVIFDVSLLRFQFLDQRARALEDMKILVETYNGIQGGGNDSIRAIWYENYGNMCVNEGLNFRNKDRSIALKYFLQGTTFAWSGQYRCYIDMADLSMNKPEKVLEYCSKAMDNGADLSINDQLDALKMMYIANKRLRRPDETRDCAERYKLLQKQAGVGNQG